MQVQIEVEVRVDLSEQLSQLPATLDRVRHACGEPSLLLVVLSEQLESPALAAARKERPGQMRVLRESCLQLRPPHPRDRHSCQRRQRLGEPPLLSRRRIMRNHERPEQHFGPMLARGRERLPDLGLLAGPQRRRERFDLVDVHAAVDWADDVSAVVPA